MVTNCIVSTVTNDPETAEVEFLDAVYKLDSVNDSLYVKMVRNLRTNGNTIVGFKTIINNIEIDILNLPSFDSILKLTDLKQKINLKNKVKDVQFLHGEKEKLIKICGKNFTEISSERLTLRIFVKKSDFDCIIGQRNEATIFMQKNRGFYIIF